MARYRTRRNNNLAGSIIAGIFILAAIGLLIEYILPILVIAGVGYGVYRLATRQTRLEKVNTAQRLQDLKDDIHQADRQVKLLDNYLDEHEYTQYTVLARQLLPQVQNIKSEATDLKDKMDLKIYKRVTHKADAVIQDIKAQLERLDIAPEVTPTSDQEMDILKRAPELRQTYTNIQRDHAEILAKIEKADNKAELTALHQASMARFQDILDGYLKIKESPKDFYKADERMAEAKVAMEKFDLELDETLRQLNESDMTDFDISLRMMKDKG